MNIKKQAYRVMPGRGARFAGECFQGGFIGADYGLQVNLSGKLPEDWREFNREFVPLYLQTRPEKSKIAAGLACGALHTVCKAIQNGDLVLCPDGQGAYRLGEVSGEYFYAAGEILPHRRPVKWFERKIGLNEMSPELQKSMNFRGTVCSLGKHTAEIENLLAGEHLPDLLARDEDVEDPAVFALEKHLEDFLVKNWGQTSLGKTHDIYEDEGELIGQQYPTDTGAIDILALSKDKKELLVVELKKGRASDVVVGQIQRYMGYVLDELAEEGQSVRGVIIALEEDLRLQRALRVANTIDFYRYQVSFTLYKG